jgi:hypothetical protein
MEARDVVKSAAIEAQLPFKWASGTQQKHRPMLPTLGRGRSHVIESQCLIKVAPQSVHSGGLLRFPFLTEA